MLVVLAMVVRIAASELMTMEIMMTMICVI